MLKNYSPLEIKIILILILLHKLSCEQSEQITSSLNNKINHVSINFLTFQSITVRVIKKVSDTTLRLRGYIGIKNRKNIYGIIFFYKSEKYWGGA